MLRLMKGAMLAPSDTFAELDEKKFFLPVCLLVFLVGMLARLPSTMMPGTNTAGAVVFLFVGAIAHMLAWVVLGLLAHLLAASLMSGLGGLKATLTAIGLAETARFVGVAIIAIATPLGFARSLAPVHLFTLAWYFVLVVIAIREAHEFGTGRAVVGAVVPVALSLLLWVMVLGAPDDMTRPLMVNMLEQSFGEESGEWWSELPEGYVNLVKNPGFEEEATEVKRAGMPAAWQAQRGVTRILWPQMCRDTSDSCFGEASAVIRRGPPAIGGQIGWWQAIDRKTSGGQEEGEAFLSVWLKLDDVDSAAVAVLFTDSKGRPVERAHIVTGTVSGTQNWTRYRLKNVLPAEAEKAGLVIWFWGKGTLWVDDVGLFVKKAPEEKEKEAEAPVEAAQEKRAETSPNP